MKRVKGGDTVLRGSITMNTHANRIQLFDGSFETGYRLVEFRIIPRSPQNQEEVNAIIATEPQGAVPSTFDFNNNENVGYACWNVPNQTEHADWNLIIDDNMIVEDLWISCYTTGDDTDLNYYIRLEKYEFSDWTGALTMVRSRSQS